MKKLPYGGAFLYAKEVAATVAGDVAVGHFLVAVGAKHGKTSLLCKFL